MKWKIKFYEPEIGKLESLYALDAIRDKEFSRGKYIEKFTNALKERVGCEYVSLCSSGSTGCHLAMLSLGIREDDEIILSAITYVATGNAIKYCGATPIFCDVNEDTWNINTGLIENLITEKTKAIFYTDILGNPVNIQSLRDLQSRNNNIFLAGDCAQSLSSRYNSIEACGLPDVAVTSFYGSKIITSGGEGGALFTDSKIIYSRIEHYKGQAQTSQYFHNKVGFNYRLNNISSAIGYAQLHYLDKILDKKKNIYRWYRDFLERYPVKFQKILPKYESNYWVVGVQFDTKRETDKVKKSLTERSVEWRRMFYPLNQLPMYKNCKTSTMNVANKLTDTVILLPSHSLLDFESIEYICDVIKRNF